MHLARFWSWRAAVGAFVGAPLSVLLHELAHVGALELGGIAAHLRGFSMGMPVEYFWDFDGLENASAHYSVSGAVIATAALAGPIVTLLVGYGGLAVYRRIPRPALWAAAFSAILLRMVGITTNMPRFVDGSIDTSDEAIAAHFIGAPLSSFYWPSLMLGYFCIYLLLAAADSKKRTALIVSAVVAGAVGYFSVDALANLIVFKPDIWVR